MDYSTDRRPGRIQEAALTPPSRDFIAADSEHVIKWHLPFTYISSFIIISYFAINIITFYLFKTYFVLHQVVLMLVDKSVKVRQVEINL